MKTDYSIFETKLAQRILSLLITEYNVMIARNTMPLDISGYIKEFIETISTV